MRIKIVTLDDYLKKTRKPLEFKEIRGKEGLPFIYFPEIDLTYNPFTGEIIVKGEKILLDTRQKEFYELIRKSKKYDLP